MKDANCFSLQYFYENKLHTYHQVWSYITGPWLLSLNVPTVHTASKIKLDFYFAKKVYINLFVFLCIFMGRACLKLFASQQAHEEIWNVKYSMNFVIQGTSLSLYVSVCVYVHVCMFVCMPKCMCISMVVHVHVFFFLFADCVCVWERER